MPTVGSSAVAPSDSALLPAATVVEEQDEKMEQYGKLAVSVVGIYTCYLMYGVFQEALYKRQADGTQYSATAFVLFVQCATNGLIAFVGHMIQEYFFGGAELRARSAAKDHGASAVSCSVTAHGRWTRALPSMAVIRTSAVYVLAMYTSNEALAFVSYPTQALVKSCKMIPVMLGSMLISGKRYSLVKYACVLLMSLGITWFQFAAEKKPKGSHGPVGTSGATAHIGPVGGENLGMLLLLASLVLDGVTGPFQEVLRKEFNLSNMEQMLVNNIWAAALMLVIAVGLDQVGPSLVYMAEHPSMVQALVLFSLCSAFGQIFIFWTIRVFNALTLSTITTTRKFFTILMSVVVHGNKLVRNQWFAVLTVFAGLVLEMFADGGKHGHHKGPKVKVEDAAEPRLGAGGGAAGATLLSTPSESERKGHPHRQ